MACSCGDQRAQIATTLAGNLWLGEVLMFLSDVDGPNDCGVGCPSFTDVAKSAVQFTDILLAELERTKGRIAVPVAELRRVEP